MAALIEHPERLASISKSLAKTNKSGGQVMATKKRHPL